MSLSRALPNPVSAAHALAARAAALALPLLAAPLLALPVLVLGPSPPAAASVPAVAPLPPAAPAAPTVPTVPTAAHRRDRPGCGEANRTDFPIASRLSGGPDAYERGAPAPAWELELRNVTGQECRDVHPVAVLADGKRALRPEHIHLEFYDKDGARWRPVRFERTEEAENVGVFDGGSSGFHGFSVPAGRTVVVPLRLGFTDAAPDGRVTANVTAVQRRGADGAWVGESGDYTFTVTPAPTAPAASPPARPGPTPHAVPAPGRDPGPPALAATGGPHTVPVLGTAAAVCLAGGAGLLLWARRMRR
ncbi:hypothetical protein J7W19_11585 [Streptomyces mobaraensis NBRC 13819 = DSM 40847]|uniref:LPXTG-motif cell wall anchor domain-containing protein n=1 Tax=Streptomyces mobaraensis (strain ATCC 29032 / DSM 40847 / JCM 4168 / NBRC 13819 / NCIMB 11159 / IPCR 16-22) TaxID=1223523 RepID=M3AY86_STRM1|nr:hypothetical protein [Streptomyces mobaraensis]EME98612.1 LPXTG-motif cell wall anchor domain-containing protein [Streptomyces mobaraensis NBRC 13819 = DSM 40847]QTT73969.1 hypothetical protein J7W19_11585 [Streptomyces mobaraensis NBRC 13819 = DSM 40847]